MRCSGAWTAGAFGDFSGFFVNREEWSHWIGPEVVLIAGPLAVLTKEALRALRAAGDSPDRQARIREILECARKELEEFVRASRSSSKD